MQLTSFQNPEIRDSSDKIIQAGAYGKNSALVNAQNTGILDYINNNLMYLYNNKANGDNVYTKTEADGRYLKLSGGALSGREIKRSVATDILSLIGGNGTDSAPNGAKLALAGASKSGNAGCFWLQANDGTDSIQLTGQPNGSLTWASKEVERVNTSGTNYIRYESGLQICWGSASINITSNTYITSAITYPQAFVSSPLVTTSIYSNSTANADMSNIQAGYGNATKTGCNIYIWAGTLTAGRSPKVEYIAIGQWK